MIKAVSIIAVTLACLLCSPSRAAPAGYSLSVLPTNGAIARFSHINDAGVVAGYVSGETVLRYPDGALTFLPKLAEQQPGITALGNDGAVGLVYLDPGVPDRILQGAVWRNGTAVALPSLRTIQDGYGYSVINRISSDGRMAGMSAVDSGFYDDYGSFFPHTHAVIYAGGQLQDLGTLGGNTSAAYGINDRGQVVGVSTNASSERESFIYENGAMRALGLGQNYTAFDINDAGQVLANSGTSPNGAVLWTDGQVTELSLEGYGMSTAASLNNQGDVVGRILPNGGGRAEGFIYSDGQLALLRSLVIEPGWSIYEVEDINDGGAIIALGCRAAECSYVLLTPVPEPAAWMTFVSGLGMIAYAVQRRQRRRPVG